MDPHLLNLEIGESFEQALYCYVENITIEEIERIITKIESTPPLHNLWILGMPINLS